MGRLVKFVPVEDKDVMSFVWVLPYVEKDLKHQPLYYFSNLFSNQGENSLLSYLSDHRLVKDITTTI